MKTKLLILLILTLAFPLVAQITQSQTIIPISVSVTGFVAKPGVYQLTQFSRLSDALDAAAGKLKQPDIQSRLSAPETKAAAMDSIYVNFQALRDVKLQRQSQTSTYDLMRFLRAGDASQNPLLKDGDVVTVSAIQQSVAIQGDVYMPGEYQYLPTDKLADILKLCQGFVPSADLRSVKIYRYKDNRIDFDMLAYDLSTFDTNPEVADIALEPFDRVLVSRDSEKRRGWKVLVEGNVRSPGEYYIGDGTTLYDLLQMCGGPTSRGDLRNAVYINGPYSKALDPDFERLKMYSLNQMTPVEYAYLRARMRQLLGKYSVDVAKVWESQGESDNPVLRDGDYLFVPEAVDMVAVTGQVKSPGMVPWVEGKNWKYYISEAGGYVNNRKSNGTRIIRFNNGNWIKPTKKVQILPGDMVFVPESQDRDLWTDVKDVFTLASSLLTIFLSIRAITTN
jgi:protein involved in polysaccharide export with SLBB domain